MQIKSPFPQFFVVKDSLPGLAASQGEFTRGLPAVRRRWKPTAPEQHIEGGGYETPWSTGGPLKSWLPKVIARPGRGVCSPLAGSMQRNGWRAECRSGGAFGKEKGVERKRGQASLNPEPAHFSVS
jgi:hypothetical protein